MPDDDGFSIEGHCIAKLKETTICKKFCKAGILDSTLNVVSCDLDEDPFLAADESMALQGLIDETMTGCDHCECRG